MYSYIYKHVYRHVYMHTHTLSHTHTHVRTHTNTRFINRHLLLLIFHYHVLSVVAIAATEVVLVLAVSLSLLLLLLSPMTCLPQNAMTASHKCYLKALAICRTYGNDVFLEIGLAVVRGPYIRMFEVVTRVPWVAAMTTITAKLEL